LRRWLKKGTVEMTESFADISAAIIENLSILAEGCRIHPGYRAKRKATGNCAPCMRMYEARLALNALEGETEKS